MLNKEISQAEIARLRLAVFDSDGVSVPRGTEIEEHTTSEGGVEKDEIRMKTYVITDEFAALLNRLRAKLKVVVSSGRSLLYLQGMFAPIIGENTILMAENGNLSLIDGKVVQHFDYDEKYFAVLGHIREAVRELPIKGIEPKQFILSVHADREIKQVYEIVKKYDGRRELRVMWNEEAFDIQRADVSKAEGLKKLMRRLGVKKDEMIAIGDRVNDTEMIALAGIGVSADREKLKSDYWTVGADLPGMALAEYLVEKLGL